MKTIEQRKNRVVASGNSGHSHIITGECEITREGETVSIKTIKNCHIKHLIEKDFVESGIETWTGEHKEIPIPDGETYKVVHQIEFNPYSKLIEQVKD
jgi:hypothetical protein